MELSEMEEEYLAPEPPNFLIVMNKQLFLGIIFLQKSLPFDTVDIRDTGHPMYKIIDALVKEINNVSSKKIPDFSLSENQTQNLFSRKYLEEVISTNNN